MQKMCETMTRLICQASRLRADEPGLKSTSVGARMCLNCNLGIVENLYHMIMQCPIMEDIRYNMYTEHEGQSSCRGPGSWGNPWMAWKSILSAFASKLQVGIYV